MFPRTPAAQPFSGLRSRLAADPPQHRGEREQHEQRDCKGEEGVAVADTGTCVERVDGLRCARPGGGDGGEEGRADARPAYPDHLVYGDPSGAHEHKHRSAVDLPVVCLAATHPREYTVRPGRPAIASFSGYPYTAPSRGGPGNVLEVRGDDKASSPRQPSTGTASFR